MSELLRSGVERLGAAPSEEEIDAWHAVVTAAHAHDMPAGVPGPGRVETAGQLRIPASRSRIVRLVVPSPGGAPGYAGVALLRLFEDDRNRTTAWIGRLAVRPEQRRRGIGTLLWQEIQAVLEREQRQSVSVEVEIGGEGEQFARNRGFVCGLQLVLYVQRVADEVADRVADEVADQGVGEVAEGIAGDAAGPELPRLPVGYRFVEWTGAVPAGSAEAYAGVRNAMADAPMGELDQEPMRWHAETVTAAQSAYGERGGVLFTVVAEAPDGTYAALTEVGRRSPGDVRAQQYETVVAPAHRGLGLGRAVKLRMLQLLREQEPPIREIATHVADDNGPMRAVNKMLGYRPERSVGIFQAKAPGEVLQALRGGGDGSGGRVGGGLDGGGRDGDGRDGAGGSPGQPAEW
ncbi:GNAT family N-acetyltransferase [Streptomyces telluris]|uniref:GNAT family N-acetyltransferase n=1 Tax=Streptomyces telluris TaxID=2720021 RepID=A0A9X2LF20_9ACTN|nr:GNAT family N-acetyltransferase [Streptomyces telluris]MCQ8770132.1 GNAT family N-acetyltransferase [Streptomyces telluris]NJP76011.1 GNAT family N-acetyltransferase [Streptomyces telluris]